MRYRVVWLLAVSLLTGCLMGPEYRRPTVETPPAFRGDQAEAEGVSLAETEWSDVFGDTVLTELVTTALQNNHDMRIATERVLEARERFGIARSDLSPTIDLATGFSASRNSEVGAVPFPSGDADAFTQLGFSLGWEADVWGRLRRLEESALSQYFATEEARRGVATTLIADVMTAYLELRALDAELEIAEKTRAAAEDSLELTGIRMKHGVGTALDLHQAEQLLHSATVRIAASRRRIEQAENALSFLTGGLPGPAPRGRSLEELAPPEVVPAGLPSALLARRPDIRASEQLLVAANADIGAARARYFPQISLTGFLGVQAQALTDLFTGSAGQWSFNPLANLPIFNAGRVRSEVRFREAVERETLVRYEQTVQRAFREVSDALAAYNYTTDELAEQQRLVGALFESSRLAVLRYEGGFDSYLQVLDAQRSLFDGELGEVQLRRDLLLSVVDLYRALGGGWQ